MKKLVFILVLVAFSWMLPVNGNAVPVTLTAAASSPVGYISYPGHSGLYYLDYDVSINGGAYDQAFCIDLYQDAPIAQTYKYDLEPLSDEYFIMAWIADNYSDQGETASAQAQVAIWEALTDVTFDPSSGNFTSTYNTAGVNTIWDTWEAELILAGGNINNIVLEENWMIASSDVKQDYLVRRVPEPSTLLLLGAGLVGMGVFRRKFKVV